MRVARWAENSYPNLFLPSQAAIPAFDSFPIQSVTPTGMPLSIIGGAQSFFLNRPAQVLLLASGQVFNIDEALANTALFSLILDSTQVSFQQIQVPPRLSIVDGSVFSFVFLSGQLTFGTHTVDLSMLNGNGNVGGVTSLGDSSSLYFQVQG
jgi:hypothetical protein